MVPAKMRMTLSLSLVRCDAATLQPPNAVRRGQTKDHTPPRMKMQVPAAYHVLHRPGTSPTAASSQPQHHNDDQSSNKKPCQLARGEVRNQQCSGTNVEVVYNEGPNRLCRLSV